MDKLARFSVTMEADLLDRFDTLVASRGIRVNRSEAIRDLVRDALVENAVELPDTEIAGTITMVFSHHESALTERLTAVQHQSIREIVSSLHVHLDAMNCLEVIVLRGASQKIRPIANALLGTKGVRHGKLVTTTITDGEWLKSVDTHHHRHDVAHTHDHEEGRTMPRKRITADERRHAHLAIWPNLPTRRLRQPHAIPAYR